MSGIEHEWNEELGVYVETDESFERRMEETYRPDPAKPWRCTWGFGAFEDFATKEEAETLYRELGDDGMSPVVPFNAVERWGENA